MPLPLTDSSTHVERRSLKDIAVEKISEAILNGTLEPGERLRDQELQQWLGVSRTPIREALLDLERIGLVEMVAQKYTRVAIPNDAEATESLQTVGALLGGVIRISTPTMSSGFRKELGRTIDRLIKVAKAEKADEHAKLAWEMYDRIVDECENEVLVNATRGTISGLSYRLSLTRESRPTDWPALLSNYQSLKTAVLEGDAINSQLAVERLFLLPEGKVTS